MRRCGGVEEVFGWICGIIWCRTNCWKGEKVWQQQALWSVFVTIGHAIRMCKFISSPSFDCPLQTKPTVYSAAEHNTKFIVRVEVTTTVHKTCTVTWDVIVHVYRVPG
jgi:hypothetical protein